MSNLQSVDSIVHARWLIPVDADHSVLENYALILHQGRIKDRLPSSEVASHYQSHQVHHLDTHALIPGFVNAHTHAAMNLLKGYADDYALMDWLQNYIWPAEQKWISEEFVEDGCRLALAEMIRGGTTCFGDMYFYPEVAARVAHDVGIRACIGLIVIDFPSAWASDAHEYLEKGLELHDQLGQWPLITSMFAPHSPYTVSGPILEQISVLSDELNIPVQMHVHETAWEVEESIKLHQKRPLARMHELGLVNPALMAVHMTALTDDEIELLAQSGAHVVHCPESNLKLVSGLCPVDQLQKAGVNVALGTDGAASNNDLSMIGEMRTAAMIGKIVAQSSESLNAYDVLQMATLNGARALGLDQEIGSLEVGKAADAVAVNLNQIANIPIYHPVSQIIYTANDSNVSHVWIAGNLLLNEGEFCTMDENALRTKAMQWQTKIAGINES